MRYLWVAAVGAGLAVGPVEAGPPKLKVPVPAEFPQTMPVPPPPPPVIYTVAPPPPPTYARPPQPRGNPGYWATTADYPAAALREEVSGVTRFRLVVGVDGRVSQCDVIQSSGSDLLDATTCSLVTLRARFNPARDGSGEPAIGTYSNAVRWIIPVDLPPEPGAFTNTFVVGIDGSVSKCHVKSSIDDDYDGWAACPVPKFDASFTDDRGQPVARQVTIREENALANAPERLAPTAPAPREWRSSSALPSVGTRVTEAIVEIDGTVSECRIVRVTGAMAAVFRPGTNDCPKRYERGYANANGQPVRTLLRMTETVVITPIVGKR